MTAISITRLLGKIKFNKVRYLCHPLNTKNPATFGKQVHIDNRQENAYN